MHPDARSVARVLGGEVIARDRVLVPGPNHSPADRSLQVWLNPSAPAGFRVHSFAGDDPIACRDHVRERLGIPSFSAARLQRFEHKVFVPEVVVDTGSARSDHALKLWKEAVPLSGTLAYAYLRRRGIFDLPHGTDGEALRFHPSCPFGAERHPCMVGLIRDVVSNEPRAIHRTALTLKAEKIDRKVLGPKAGGAVKLSADEEVSYGLAVAEGLETALSALPFNFLPVWSLIDANNLAKLPVLAAIEALTVIADNDDSGRGQDAGRELSDRWRRSGREVCYVSLHAKGDLNDVLQEVRNA